jgi:hypothetical protein
MGRGQGGDGGGMSLAGGAWALRFVIPGATFSVGSRQALEITGNACAFVILGRSRKRSALR